MENKVEVDRQYIELSVEDADINYKGIFVSLKEKASFEDGSPEYPFSTIKEACSLAEEGENIYIRGGRYFNPGKKTTVVGCTKGVRIKTSTLPFARGAMNKYGLILMARPV
jgi:hypothetical protein